MLATAELATRVRLPSLMTVPPSISQSSSTCGFLLTWTATSVLCCSTRQSYRPRERT